MEDVRLINPSDLRLFYFGIKDVLNNPEEKEARKKKLQRAIILSKSEDVPISLYLQLPNGEKLTTPSHLADFSDEFVLLKGGTAIPVRAIFHVEI